MLEVQKLTVAYDSSNTPVIEELSFALPIGGLLAVVGASGCGKTTLINTLAGVIAPQSGQILFQSEILSPQTTRIGLIPQSYGLLPWKNVRSNILFCMGNTKVQAHELLHICERLGISLLLERYPHELSGGQAQRVALARAFIMQPRLLLMDEPFAALDIASAHRAKQLTLALFEEYGATGIVVTHRLEEAMYLATHIAVMGNKGSFIEICANPWQGKEVQQDSAYLHFAQELRQKLLQAVEEGEAV